MAVSTPRKVPPIDAIEWAVRYVEQDIENSSSDVFEGFEAERAQYSLLLDWLYDGDIPWTPKWSVEFMRDCE